MNIQEKYLALFDEIATPVLNDLGYNLSLVSKVDSGDIYINKGRRNYIITFSTHHLDYETGVVVAETEDEKLHWDKIVLPNSADLSNGKIYGFSGDNLASEILRITNDFLSYDKARLD
jgi:hypothetical protein